MVRRLLAITVACGLLAACASPSSSFSAQGSGPASFVYVAESYDLFPTRRYEAEVRRLQALQSHLAANNLCAEAYEIDSREEAVSSPGLGAVLPQGAIYRVTYHGHCRVGPPSAEAPPPSAPLDTPTASAPLEAPSVSAPLDTPTASAPSEAPSVSAPLDAPSASEPPTG